MLRAFGAAKRLLRDSFNDTLETHLQVEARTIAERSRSAESAKASRRSWKSAPRAIAVEQERPLMTVQLDHIAVPSRDKNASAKLLVDNIRMTLVVSGA